jgi:magnesium chelatase subunit D
MSKPQLNSKATPDISAAYPFTAIVGQEEMKLALLLNAVDFNLGGVLIMGHRGTGKSTAVRSLAELLPDIAIVSSCPYRCDPAVAENLCEDCRQKLAANKKPKTTKTRVQVVNLPLGATEDRVCGSIDVERAITKGKRSFEPGLLARANRGFLYIDEVNLLDDHLVDLLLDASVTGINRVERESISIAHPARFVLVGSGNPEEGELRPQLLDRFALHVDVTTENDLEKRVEIVQRHESFERNRAAFIRRFKKEQEKMRHRIVSARQLLVTVSVDRNLLKQIAQLSAELNLDGHRGEITLSRAARALAALENRSKVNFADVKRVASMSLRHRLRSQPLDEREGGARIDQALERISSRSPNLKSKEGLTRETSSNSGLGATEYSESSSGNGSSTAHSDMKYGSDEYRESEIETSSANRKGSSTSRRRSSKKNNSNARRGRYSKATAKSTDVSAIAVDATLRAIAAKPYFQKAKVSSGDLRYKQYSRRTGLLYIFAIDTSGSMAPRRIQRAREIAIKLLRKSYLNRDSIAMVVFRGKGAKTVLPPSRSIVRARRALESLTIGGGTPLTAGLAQSLSLAKRADLKLGQPMILLFTDGGANVPLTVQTETDRQKRAGLIARELKLIATELKKARVPSVVFSTDNRFNQGAAESIALQIGARFIAN